MPWDERAGLRRRLIIGAVVLLGALPIAGCGSASTPSTTTTHTSVTHAAKAAPPPICTEKAKAAILRVEHIPSGALSTHAAKAGSGFPECVFTLRIPHRRAVRLIVENDNGPDAYAVLERTVDEAVQIWPVRFQSPPQHIDHLGIDADWFPEEQHLMTTDAVHLITATVVWPHGSRNQKVKLAVAAARTYLGPNELKLARGPAP